MDGLLKRWVTLVGSICGRRRASGGPSKTRVVGMLKLGSFVAALAMLATVGSAPAEAAGCIKGALAGGVAGHMVGHGIAGAVGGCVVGRHMANSKAAREQQAQQQNAGAYNSNQNRGSSYSQSPNNSPYDYGNSAQPTTRYNNAPGGAVDTNGNYSR